MGYGIFNQKTVRKIVKQPKNIVRLVKSKSPNLTTLVVIRNLLDSSKPRRKYTEPPYEGAHIFINQKRHGVRYQHHGIYIGDSQVIHFLNDKKGVCETSLEQFCRMSKNKRYGLIHSNCKESRDKVVRQAKKVIKDQDFKYNLAFENCEHFANYCRSGKKVFRI
ncbi:MAG: lecithin retinol acyltransferase family protein [Pseudanabaena sp.]